MNRARMRKLSIPLLLSLAVLLYILPGLVGHDPWKQDEAYSFGIISHMLRSGDWIVPTVAGEPFMEKPPLYYYSGALSAWLFSPWLPLHDAARLASGFWAFLVLWLTWRTGELLNGVGRGVLTALALASTVGLIYNIHLLFTDVALLGGFAAAFYGLARMGLRLPYGGVWLGIGAGIGFLSKGVLAPGVLAGTCVLLAWAYPSWRTADMRHQYKVAVAMMVPWIVVWPLALYLRSPTLFIEWFWRNNVGRFFGFADLGATSEPLYYLKTLPWFAFPVLPFALWTVWRERAELHQDVALQLAVMSVTLMVAVLSVSATARALYALPMLLPLSWLAARSATALAPRWQVRLDYASRIIAWIVLGSWVLWNLMLVEHRPPDLPWLRDMLPGSFTPAFDAWLFALAALGTLLYLVIMANLRHMAARAAVSWTATLTLVWTLLSTLWLPWIDFARSYRQPFAELAGILPSPPSCLLTWMVGESERPMLQYFVHVTPRDYDAGSASTCGYLLEETMKRPSPRVPGPEWALLWQGHRPGDSREQFSLYARKTSTQLPGINGQSTVDWLIARTMP